MIYIVGQGWTMDDAFSSELCLSDTLLSFLFNFKCSSFAVFHDNSFGKLVYDRSFTRRSAMSYIKRSHS